MTADPEQRCYEAFVAAIAEAMRCASPAMVDDDTVSHEHMLSGLAGAHLHGVACTVDAVAKVTGRPVGLISNSMIAALHRHIDGVMAGGEPA